MMLPVDSKPIFFFLQAHDANKMVNNEGMTCGCFDLKKQKNKKQNKYKQ